MYTVMPWKKNKKQKQPKKKKKPNHEYKNVVMYKQGFGILVPWSDSTAEMDAHPVTLSLVLWSLIPILSRSHFCIIGNIMENIHAKLTSFCILWISVFFVYHVHDYDYSFTNNAYLGPFAVQKYARYPPPLPCLH